MEANSHLQKMRKYFADISGPGVGNHPKAHVIIRYYEQYHDGTQRDIQVYSVDKPILTMFSNGPFIYVGLDFRYRDDMDLRMAWRLLSDYRNPLNSVSYLPEEIERGYYMDGNEKKKVYYPMLEVIFSPIGREGHYEMHGLNPLVFNLSASSLASQELSVLQMTFDAGWFHIFEDLKPLDSAELRAELMKEMEEAHLQ